MLAPDAPPPTITTRARSGSSPGPVRAGSSIVSSVPIVTAMSPRSGPVGTEERATSMLVLGRSRRRLGLGDETDQAGNRTGGDRRLPVARSSRGDRPRRRPNPEASPDASSRPLSSARPPLLVGGLVVAACTTGVGSSPGGRRIAVAGTLGEPGGRLGSRPAGRL